MPGGSRVKGNERLTLEQTKLSWNKSIKLPRDSKVGSPVSQRSNQSLPEIKEINKGL